MMGLSAAPSASLLMVEKDHGVLKKKTEHEPAMSLCSKDHQQPQEVHQEELWQHAEGGDPSPQSW